MSIRILLREGMVRILIVEFQSSFVPPFLAAVYWAKGGKMKKIASLLIIILIASASTASAKQKGRKYYLTQTTVTGSQALTACTKKFHMASF
jgi:hypothetical protein